MKPPPSDGLWRGRKGELRSLGREDLDDLAEAVGQVGRSATQAVIQPAHSPIGHDALSRLVAPHADAQGRHEPVADRLRTKVAAEASHLLAILHFGVRGINHDVAACRQSIADPLIREAPCFGVARVIFGVAAELLADVVRADVCGIAVDRQLLERGGLAAGREANTNDCSRQISTPVVGVRSYDYMFILQASI